MTHLTSNALHGTAMRGNRLTAEPTRLHRMHGCTLPWRGQLQRTPMQTCGVTRDTAPWENLFREAQGAVRRDISRGVEPGCGWGDATHHTRRHTSARDAAVQGRMPGRVRGRDIRAIQSTSGDHPYMESSEARRSPARVTARHPPGTGQLTVARTARRGCERLAGGRGAARVEGGGDEWLHG